jgi:hypothetical protein
MRKTRQGWIDTSFVWISAIIVTTIVWAIALNTSPDKIISIKIMEKQKNKSTNIQNAGLTKPTVFDKSEELNAFYNYVHRNYEVEGKEDFNYGLAFIPKDRDDHLDNVKMTLADVAYKFIENQAADYKDKLADYDTASIESGGQDMKTPD